MSCVKTRFFVCFCAPYLSCLTHPLPFPRSFGNILICHIAHGNFPSNTIMISMIRNGVASGNLPRKASVWLFANSHCLFVKQWQFFDRKFSNWWHNFAKHCCEKLQSQSRLCLNILFFHFFTAKLCYYSVTSPFFIHFAVKLKKENQNMFISPRQIYLKYLGAFEMRKEDAISIRNI